MLRPMENNNKKLTLFLRRAASILIDTLSHDMLSREIIVDSLAANYRLQRI